MIEPVIRQSYKIIAANRTLELGVRTAIMGILNVTPDSFSDGGHFYESKTAIDRAWQIAEEGADILDMGGESSRPGSKEVSTEEELRRILPVLNSLVANNYPLPISIDTYKSEVARITLENGASIINDIYSLQKEPEIGTHVAKHGAALVLMHMRGNPGNMQLLPPSDDILSEIDTWAHEAVTRAQKYGVSSDKLILDPGIGFGKTAGQNIELIRNLNRLAVARFPILIGTSRKSFIGTVLKKPPRELVLGTGVTVTASILFGAHIVRVHDVAAMREIADMADAFL
jgi:dihydropteroate synthase